MEINMWNIFVSPSVLSILNAFEKALLGSIILRGHCLYLSSAHKFNISYCICFALDGAPDCKRAHTMPIQKQALMFLILCIGILFLLCMGYG